MNFDKATIKVYGTQEEKINILKYLQKKFFIK